MMRFPAEVYQLAQVLSGVPTPEQAAPPAWQQVLQAATKQQLLPSTFQAFKAAYPDVLDEATSRRLNSYIKTQAMKQLYYVREMAQVDRALHAAGIPTIWFKGIIIAQTAYPPPKIRNMADVDLLVPATLRTQALAVLAEFGYRERDLDETITLANDDIPTNQAKAVALERRDGDQGMAAQLDLHYHLLRNHNDYLPADKLQWMTHNVHLVRISGYEFTTFLPELHLLYVAAHAVLQHGIYFTTLRNYYDIYCMVRDPALNIERLVTWAAYLGWGSSLDQALAIVQELFQYAEAQALRDALQATPDDPHRHQIDMMVDERVYVTKVLRHFRQASFVDRLKLMRLLLLPSAAYIRQRYQCQSWVQVALGYPRYWLTSSWKYGRSLAKYLGTMAQNRQKRP